MLEKRILEVFQYSKLSRQEFADKLKISNAVISHISSGRNKASMELIVNLLNSFPEIDTNWLIKGEGNMLGGDELKLKETAAEAIKRTVLDLEKSRQLIENQIIALKALLEKLK
jgi:transcriptional regulator with XRE-family HTH domain